MLPHPSWRARFDWEFLCVQTYENSSCFTEPREPKKLLRWDFYISKLEKVLGTVLKNEPDNILG